MTDTVDVLARHVATVTFDSLPPRVVGLVKLFTLDTLGTMIGGSSQPGAREMAGLVKDFGGKPEGTIAVYGGAAPAPWAALANSVMAHAMDLDDLHDESVVHVFCSQLPVALALAERSGKLSGRDIITSMAIGTDLAARLGVAIGAAIGFVRSGTCNIFGAAANAAKLLGLAEQGTRHAMGICLSQTAGTAQAVIDGAMVKRMQPGLMSADAILAALMAERGVRGPVGVMDGKYGFFELYKRGETHHERLTEGLGEFYEIENLTVKPYCGGRYIHGAAEASIAIVTANSITPDQIAKMTVFMPRMAYNYAGRPFALGDTPQVNAQFSAAYAAAVGAIRHNMFIDEIQESVIRDPLVLDMAQRRTSCVVDDTVANPDATAPISVEIETTDGRKFYKRIEYFKGHPKNFLSKDEFVEKFRKVTSWSAYPVPQENLDRIVELVDRLETLEDPSILLKLAQPER